MYLLDTDSCIGLLNGTAARLAARLREHAPSEIRLCSVVKAELFYGARHSSQVDENLELLARFFSAIPSTPFDDACAQHYGLIRADLARSGNLIGPNDLLIAATARAHDLTLVTHNKKEFGRVVGLRVADWEGE